MDEPGSEAGDIPEKHAGLEYDEFMSTLSEKRGTRRYLEIGVNDGHLMSFIHSDIAVGVDPDFVISWNIARHKHRTCLIKATSDRFFASSDMLDVLSGPPDLCFLDGYHAYEFLLRDFINTERISDERSLIVLHDCLPLDTVMTIRYYEDWKQKTIGTHYSGWWTGDVWKIIPVLMKYRPDLKITYVDCPPTGLVCVSNLNPACNILWQNYLDILHGFRDIQSTEAEIRRMYRSIEITSSHRILREFDHSSYFRV